MRSEPVSPNTDLKITRALTSINAARWFDFSNVEASLAARGDPLALQEISYLKTPASSSPASRRRAVNKEAEEVPVALNFDELADSLSTDDQENKQTVGEAKLVVNQDIPKTALNTPGGFARLREAARRRSANIVVEPEKPVEKPKPVSVRQSGSRPVFMKRSSAASQDTSTKKPTVAPILRAPRNNSFYDSVTRSPKRAPRSESVTRVPERVPRPGVGRRAPPPRSASLSRAVLPPNEWERAAANRIALRKPVTWTPPTRTASTGPDRPVTTASSSIRARRPASTTRNPSRGPAQPPPKSSNQPTIPISPKFATSQRMRASHSASKDDSKHQEGDHHHKPPTAIQLQATIDRLSQPKKR